MKTGNQAQAAADQELVRRILAGDRRAFDEFADDYLPQLYRFASRRLAGDREATAEVVQSTTCKALSKLAGFRGEAALMTWLCAVCRNEIAAHFRELGKRRSETEFDTVEQASPDIVHGSTPVAQSGFEGPERAAVRRESAQRVHDLLDRMPPRYASVLEMKYLQDISVREIAARLEISAKAAESLLTRARNAFRGSWGELSAEASAANDAAPPVTTARGSR